MELQDITHFKRKRGRKGLQVNLPFPLLVDPLCPLVPFVGQFCGSSVQVSDQNGMDTLHSHGYFGKGNLSRSNPNRSVAVSEGVEESLHLSLEEAFFLSHALGVLQVEWNGVALNLDEMWVLFKNSSANFASRYVAYHHFRHSGWTVKSGLKFGSDFLLYKHGPEFYHASYSVKVIDCSHSLELAPNFNWVAFAGMDRVTESTAKELLFCYVLALTDSDDVECLNHAKIHEVVWERWVGSQERDALQPTAGVQR